MQRKKFIQLSTIGSLGLGFPFYACKNNASDAKTSIGTSISDTNFEKLASELLTTWCDAMIASQMNTPDQPTLHGALHCDACNKIHGRCMDAVYPFMFMADTTGEEKYLKAAIEVMEWSKNVSMPDGSWTVIPDPKSWKGITVFGAIALGEALHHHGHILPPDIRTEWTNRLAQATEYVFQNFTMEYSHVNYPFTAIYALNFIGKFLEEPKYVSRSRELAVEIPKWLTKPNALIFGENKPANARSAKGLLPVDLGYNVEETLNGVVQYAILEKDDSLLQLLTQSLQSHLEFMLPDGGWDNSWGTRQNKWSYWGSRTTDGCQPAFVLLAEKNPAFGTAVILNTELLQQCTVNGLLSGGLHYESHGIKPCIHHTFAHAKNVTFLLNHTEKTRTLNKNTPIPRSVRKGIKHFPEIDVWLASQGPWKATVSSYDQIFKKKYSVAATGGSLAILWHEEVGPLFTASMAEYILVEKNNQQPQPGEDFCLTPRIERYVDGVWYTNIHDLQAKVKEIEEDDKIRFEINTKLTNREKEVLSGVENYSLEYSFDNDKTTIKVMRSATELNGDTLVLPLISPVDETVKQPTPNSIEIDKPKGTVILEANVPLSIKKTQRKRVFNMVPGVQAIPILASFPQNTKEIICTIKVVTKK